MIRLAALLLLVGPAARAAEETDARAMELYDNGVVLYDEGLYEDAITAWNAAYRISERPALLYNIANAEERLGQYQDALDHLNRYRAYALSDERATLDRRISNLERRLEDRALAKNATPLPAPTPTVVTAAPIPPAPVRTRARTAPVALYSVSGVGLATGAAFGTLAFSARREAGDLCVAGDGSTWCPAGAEAPIVRDRTLSTIADVGYAVAVVGAIGGTVALVLPRRDRLEVGVSTGPRGTGVRIAGSF